MPHTTGLLISGLPCRTSRKYAPTSADALLELKDIGGCISGENTDKSGITCVWAIIVIRISLQ
jgi:hypothetical protein